MEIDLDTFLTTVYDITDTLYQRDYAPHKPARPGKKPELSDSEVLTLALLAQWQADLCWLRVTSASIPPPTPWIRQPSDTRDEGRPEPGMRRLFQRCRLVELDWSRGPEHAGRCLDAAVSS